MVAWSSYRVQFRALSYFDSVKAQTIDGERKKDKKSVQIKIIKKTVLTEHIFDRIFSWRSVRLLHTDHFSSVSLPNEPGHEKCHMRTTKALINAFVVHCLDNIISLDFIAKISRL